MVEVESFIRMVNCRGNPLETYVDCVNSQTEMTFLIRVVAKTPSERIFHPAD
jgi:hypothetical protein